MPLQPLARSGRTIRSAQTNLTERVTSGAPVNGITSQKSIAEMNTSDAVQLRNFIVKPFGVELRHGYQLHQNNLGNRVNTIMPYQARNPVDDRLFGVVYEGIFDITSRTDNAVQPPYEFTFATQTEFVTDVWSHIPFSNLGENFLCAVSEFNGYITYDATSGWIDQNAALTGPVGFDTLELDYITNWKRRLWFVPQASTKAYYLPVNQITGVVQEFDFGPYMRQGGEIKQLVTWTRDGGEGMDDFLIIIGSEGDVLVYQGTDPANADTFQMVGVWDVGSVPFGRRVAMKSGGDVKILCESGLVDLSVLFQGAVNIASPESLGYPVQTILAAAVSDSLDTEQWEIHYYPRDELFLVKEPVAEQFISPQIWTANIHSRGWSYVNEYPQQTMGLLSSELYSSDAVGNVYQLFVGDVDNLDFASSSDEITGLIQVGFSNYDQATLKKFQMVQPTFQASVAPAIQLEMKTEFNFSAIPGSPQFASPEDFALWDDAKWDQAFWSGARGTFQAWLGVNGVGFFGSLMIKVRGSGGTIFTHWTVTFEQGGVL